MLFITKFWKQITVFATSITALGAAVVAYDDLRPFPTRYEMGVLETRVIEVAGRSCRNQLAWLRSEQRDIERRLSDAEMSNNRQLIRTLREQLQDVLHEIERVRRTCGWS